MFSHSTQVRVRYADTDQMGYVYYGNYAAFYETGRVEALRSLGISYKKLEESGILMPVASMESRYLKPARYDDLLTIKTTLATVPAASICFGFEVFGPDNLLLNTGVVTLVFISRQTMKPVRCPAMIEEKLIPLFNKA